MTEYGHLDLSFLEIWGKSCPLEDTSGFSKKQELLENKIPLDLHFDPRSHIQTC